MNVSDLQLTDETVKIIQHSVNDHGDRNCACENLFSSGGGGPQKKPTEKLMLHVC